MELKLEDLKRVNVQRGDRFVVRAPDCLPRYLHLRIQAAVGSALGVAEQHVLVLDGGLELAVVGLEDQRRIPDLLDANTRTWDRNARLSAALSDLLAALVADFGPTTGEEDAQPVAFPATVLTFGHLRRAEDALNANGKPVVEHVADAGAFQIGRAAWPQDDKLAAPVVPVKEAGPIVAGGQSLVSAFMHANALSDRLDPHASPEDLLRDFVAFAADQLKAKVAAAGAASAELHRVQTGPVVAVEFGKPRP